MTTVLQSEFDLLLRTFGETVTYTDVTDANSPVQVKAYVQSPSTAPLVADADQEGLTLFVSHVSLPVSPKKFDRFTVRGVERTVHDVSGTSMGDVNLVWQIRVLG